MPPPCPDSFRIAAKRGWVKLGFRSLLYALRKP
jgi:hypothetical protein